MNAEETYVKLITGQAYVINAAGRQIEISDLLITNLGSGGNIVTITEILNVNKNRTIYLNRGFNPLTKQAMIFSQGEDVTITAFDSTITLFARINYKGPVDLSIASSVAPGTVTLSGAGAGIWTAPHTGTALVRTRGAAGYGGAGVVDATGGGGGGGGHAKKLFSFTIGQQFPYVIGASIFSGNEITSFSDPLAVILASADGGQPGQDGQDGVHGNGGAPGLGIIGDLLTAGGYGGAGGATTGGGGGGVGGDIAGNNGQGGDEGGLGGLGNAETGTGNGGDGSNGGSNGGNPPGGGAGGAGLGGGGSIGPDGEIYIVWPPP